LTNVGFQAVGRSRQPGERQPRFEQSIRDRFGGQDMRHGAVVEAGPDRRGQLAFEVFQTLIQAHALTGERRRRRRGRGRDRALLRVSFTTRKNGEQHQDNDLAGHAGWTGKRHAHTLQPDETSKCDFAMTLDVFGLTDVGRLRERNEDSYILRPDIGLFAVADGMGGHVAGEVASRAALDALAASLTIAHADEASVLTAIRTANLVVRERGDAEPEKAGMGTTLTALLFSADGAHAIIGHVGDSRVYRLRAGVLEQLTRDHTAVQEMVDAGQLTKKAAQRHPLSNMLFRSIGTKADVDVDRVTLRVESGDLFLICSDGLTGMIDDDELPPILVQDKTLQQIGAELIDTANQRGGIDNVTVILIRVE